MENKILHSSTTLYKVLQHFYTTLTKFYKTLNNFMIFLKLYKNLQSFYKTLLNSTRNYTQLDQTIQTIQNQPYTTIQNSTGFYKALHNFTKLCKTLHNFYTTIHKQMQNKHFVLKSNTLHNSTTLYTTSQTYTKQTLHNLTQVSKLCTIKQILAQLYTIVH